MPAFKPLLFDLESGGANLHHYSFISILQIYRNQHVRASCFKPRPGFSTKLKLKLALCSVRLDGDLKKVVLRCEITRG